MRTRRYAQRTDGERALFPELVDLLIHGWGERPTREYPDSDPFRVFELSDADLERAWQTHRKAILKEATRRDVLIPWAMRYYELERPPYLPPLTED